MLESSFAKVSKVFFKCERKPLRSALFICIAALMVSRSIADQAYSVEGQQPGVIAPPNTATILLLTGVIWDGSPILEKNHTALSELYQSHPSLPFTHFINPNYFFSADDISARNAQKLRSMIRSIDATALYLVPNKAIVESSGVIFRSGPTFWGYEVTEDECLQWCGHDVPLTVYALDDLRKMTETALRSFSHHNIAQPNGFLANGWLTNGQLRRVVAEFNLHYDFSAVPLSLLTQKLKSYPIYEWIYQQWPNITPYAQPEPVNTVAGAITQITNNAVSLDYLTADQIADLFESYIKLAQHPVNQTLIFQLNISLATANKYLPRANDTLAKIFASANENKINIIPVSITPDRAISQTIPFNQQAH